MIIDTVDLVYGYHIEEEIPIEFIKYLCDNNMLDYSPNYRRSNDIFYIGILILQYENSQNIFEYVKSFKNILENNRDLYNINIDKKIKNIIEFIEDQIEDPYEDNNFDKNILLSSLEYFKSFYKIYPKELSLPTTMEN